MEKYKVSDEQKLTFGGIVILNLMINNQKAFNVNLPKEYLKVQKFFDSLYSKGLIEIKDGKYLPTNKGRENLLNFYKKFWEFIRVFQVFQFVDLENGIFAYSDYWNMSADQFDKYIDQPNWENCIIAVAEFKKIDPIELIFMDKIDRGYFSLDDDKWLCIEPPKLWDNIWFDIEEVCNKNLHLEDLTQDDAIINVINQGTELFINLLKEENERLKEEVVEEIVEEVIVTEYYVEPIYIGAYDYYYDPYYYDGYYDPYYISPCWGVVIY